MAKETLSGQKKIKRITMSDQVSDELFRYIKEGKWAAGERIPSEEDLAKAFDVNRLTVRMALQKMNTLGLLKTCVGDGTYVTDMILSDNISEITKYYMDDKLLDDVCTFRLPIEAACIDYARQNATPEEIIMLRDLSIKYRDKVLQLDSAKNDDVLDELVQRDYEYHYTLCRISHNALLASAYAMAKEPICQYLRIIIQKRNNNELDMKFDETNLDQDPHIQLCDYLEKKTKEPAIKKKYLSYINYKL